MRYIKLFEDIDWDWVEEDENENIPIYKIGDKVKMYNFYVYYPDIGGFAYPSKFIKEEYFLDEENEDISSEDWIKINVLYD